MGNKVILIDREDLQETIIEEQRIFVLDILLKCGVPEDSLGRYLGSFTASDKVSFLDLCKSFSISIMESADHFTEVVIKNGPESISVAKWEAPDVIMQVEGNKIFLQVHFAWWSTFEEENGKDNT